MPGATFLLDDAYTAFGVVVSDGAMTAGGSNPRLLTSATAAFKASDVGKKITVEDAGAASADLTTKIARLISATKVELEDPALTTVTGSDISYVKGVYRLSHLIAQGDVGGNRYQFISARRIQIQLGSLSPGGSLFIGGPYVSPTNHGIEIQGGSADDFVGLAVTTSDYLCSDTDNQILNVYWQDDLNLSTPA